MQFTKNQTKIFIYSWTEALFIIITEIRVIYKASVIELLTTIEYYTHWKNGS